MIEYDMHDGENGVDSALHLLPLDMMSWVSSEYFMNRGSTDEVEASQPRPSHMADN